MLLNRAREPPDGKQTCSVTPMTLNFVLWPFSVVLIARRECPELLQLGSSPESWERQLLAESVRTYCRTGTASSAASKTFTETRGMSLSCRTRYYSRQLQQ
jgi:hypothetical protein